MENGWLQRIRQIRGLLSHRSHLLETGWSDSQIVAAVRAGRLKRVRRGWYVDAETLSRLSPEERHLLSVISASGNSSPGRSELESPIAHGALTMGVYSHHSAAVLWSLPLYNLTEEPLHLTLPESHFAMSTSNVRRHRLHLPASSVTEIDGLPCTTLVRTVLDLARAAIAEITIAAADAALRSMPATSISDSDPLLAGLEELPMSRNLRQARRTLEFADARAESPLESVSRLYLRQLGFEVDLQVPVPSPNGGTYRIDLELVGLETLCEVDGKGKYMGGDPDIGEPIEEVTRTI